jgi:hypothetical protein
MLKADISLISVRRVMIVMYMYHASLPLPSLNITIQHRTSNERESRLDFIVIPKSSAPLLINTISPSQPLSSRMLSDKRRETREGLTLKSRVSWHHSISSLPSLDRLGGLRPCLSAPVPSEVSLEEQEKGSRSNDLESLASAFALKEGDKREGG